MIDLYDYTLQAYNMSAHIQEVSAYLEDALDNVPSDSRKKLRRKINALQKSSDRRTKQQNKKHMSER